MGSSDLALRLSGGVSDSAFPPRNARDKHIPTNPENIPRLQAAWERFLNTRIDVGNDFQCTVKDVLSEPQTRTRLLSEIIVLLNELFNNLMKSLQQRIEDFKNSPTLLAADRVREEFINLKVINLIFKLVHEFLKIVSEPMAKLIKHSGSFFKIAKKVCGVRDLDFRKINFSELLKEDVLHEIYKAIFNTLKIPASIIDFANDNPFMIMAYEAAGLGETYKPFTGFLVDWAEAISPWLTAFKIGSQVWTLKTAIYEIRHIKTNNPEAYNKRFFIVVKAVATLGTEVLKVGIKVSLISSTGVIGMWIIPVGGCLVASMGLYQVYKECKIFSRAQQPAASAA